MPRKGQFEDIENRFYRFVDKNSSPKGCWFWKGAISWGGYGFFAAISTRQGYAHRWIWEHTYGPIPDGLTVDHLCLTRNCVNPEHMQLLTRSANASKGRQVTHCIRGHEFTPENTKVAKTTGKRECRKCIQQRRTRGVRVPKEAGWR